MQLRPVKENSFYGTKSKIDQQVQEKKLMEMKNKSRVKGNM